MTNRKSTLTPATRKHAPRKKRLTELSVRNAKADGAVTTIWDTLQRGLALRVMPSGSKSWYCVYSRRGRPRWLRLGAADAIYLADARQLAAEAMLEVARGKDPAAEKRAQRASGSFSDLADRYLEHSKRVNKSWRQGRALISRYALPRWGKLQAVTITRGDIKALMASIDAPILANQVLAAVSAIFTWAMPEEILPTNPCKLVARNPVQSRERVLADSELPRFWKAFADADPVGAALKAILLTGQRPGEVAHMRREHIVDGSWWQMPGSPEPHWPGTKNAQSHRVWLPAPVQALIAEQGDSATGFVFSTPRGGPVRGLDEAMRDVCKTLGVERATPHDLRRTHGTMIASMGFGRDIMNRIQNHREGGISSVYDRHQYGPEIQHAMEAVAARIVSFAEKKREAGNVLERSFRRS